MATLLVAATRATVALKQTADFKTTPNRKLLDKVLYESKSFVNKLKFYANMLNNMRTDITNMKGATFGNLNKAIDKVDGLAAQATQGSPGGFVPAFSWLGKSRSLPVPTQRTGSSLHPWSDAAHTSRSAGVTRKPSAHASPTHDATNAPAAGVSAYSPRHSRSVLSTAA